MPRTYKVDVTIKFTDPDIVCDKEQEAKDCISKTLIESLSYAQGKGLVEILDIQAKDVGPGYYDDDYEDI